MGYWAVYLYTFAVLVRPQDWWEPLRDAQIVSVLLGLAALLAIFYKNKRLDYPQYILIGLFCAHVALSSVASGWLGGAVIKSEKIITAAILPLFALAVLVDSVDRREKLFRLIIFAAMFMVLNGHVQVNSADGFGLVGSRVTKYNNRITYIGILNDPNDLGMFFLMVVPFIAYFIAVRSGLSRFFYLLAMLMVLYGVYLTNSRGTLLGLIAMLGVWHLLNQGMAKTIVRFLLVSPLLLLVFAKFRAIDAGESSAQGRLDAWYEGMQMLQANPIFGVSLGDFVDHNKLTAHNSYVLLMAELGIPGYFLWCALIILTVLSIYFLGFTDKYKADLQSFQQSAINELDVYRLHARLMFYAMIGYLVTAFFLSRAYTPLLYIYLGLALSVLDGYRQVAQINPCVSYRDHWKHISAFVFGSVAVVWLMTRVFL